MFSSVQTEWNSVCVRCTSALFIYIELAQFNIFSSSSYTLNKYSCIHMKHPTRTMLHGNCFLSVFSTVHYRWITRSYDFTFLIVRRNYIHCMWCVQSFVSIPSFLFFFSLFAALFAEHYENWKVRSEENTEVFCFGFRIFSWSNFKYQIVLSK